MRKLKICVSACLIGFKYRYDGKSELFPALLEKLKDKADFIPVCPEVECGMAIPRDPVRLVMTARGTRMIVIRTGEDKTDTFLRWAYGKLEQLAIREPDGYLFHARSPSCGLGTTKLFTPSGRLVSETGTGLFAALFRNRFPLIPLGQETDLDGFLSHFHEFTCSGDCDCEHCHDEREDH